MASPSDVHSVGRVPRRWTALPAMGVVKIDGKKTKYTMPSVIGARAKGGPTSTKFT